MGSYRTGCPGLGLGHWVPLRQGAPVEGVPHKPVHLAWKQTATTLSIHILLALFFNQKKVELGGQTTVFFEIQLEANLVPVEI